MSIKLLGKDVINQISAGEVVEKPASVVKELVENSIDAGANFITIEIERGGIDRICVTDNGCGINKEEVCLAFTPHATSKLEKIDDLYSLNTMGFRGEALATISAVSKVTLVTKTKNDDLGIMVNLVGGEEVEREEVACVQGTKIDVLNLFYNTPARLKFLRKPKSEENDITNYVEKLILSHSDISFKYIVDGKLIYNTLNSSVLDNLYTIYGKDVADNVLEVNYAIGDYSIFGYVSKPEFSKANRTYQNLFVNNRFCNNALVSTAVGNSYEDFTMKGKFPLFVLFLNLPQSEVDVNVHPNKLEVKFVNTQKIYRLCSDAVFKALSDATHIKNLENYEPRSYTNVEYANEVSNEGVSFQTSQNNNYELYNYNLNQDNYNKYADVIASKEKGLCFESHNGILPATDNEEDFEMPQITLGGVDSFKVNDNTFTQQNTKQETYVDLFEEPYTIVGKVLNTYLILEQNKKVYFIDQHAAHERQKYDNLMRALETNSLEVQDLLLPYSFPVSREENNFIESNLELLNSFGIEISKFGENYYKISSVPVILSDINIKQFVEDVLQNTNGFIKEPKSIIKEKFMQMACKSAVKGGDDLKEIEIKALLAKIKDETKVLLCPHGRPIVVEITEKQIEKWFKRIV